MSDLQTLLTKAARPGPAASAATADADLHRGRRARTRRRLRRGASGLTAAALVTAGAFALPDGHSAPAKVAHPVSRPHGTVPAAIKLVAYTGTQPAGYTVDSVPAGWEIQGVNNYVLLIAPNGFADTRLDSFEGKLTVMLQSVDQTELPEGTPVMVGSAHGVISHADATAAQLFFTDAAGHKLDIQVPPALRWSDAQIARFGTAVHVNPGATAGRG